VKKLGPTGDFPRGKLGPTDEGGLQIGVAHDSRGNVIVNFGAHVDWIGFPPEQAIQFAKSIMKHAGATKIEITFGEGK
jgi:hypothetical protein